MWRGNAIGYGALYAVLHMSVMCGVTLGGWVSSEVRAGPRSVSCIHHSIVAAEPEVVARAARPLSAFPVQSPRDHVEVN